MTTLLPRTGIAAHLAFAAAGALAVTWGTVEMGGVGGLATGVAVWLAEALLLTAPWRASVTPDVQPMAPDDPEPDDVYVPPTPARPLGDVLPPAAAETPWAATVPDAFRRPSPDRQPRRALRPARPAPVAPTAAVWHTE